MSIYLDEKNPGKHKPFDDAASDIVEYVRYLEVIAGKSANTAFSYYCDLRGFSRFMKRRRGLVPEDSEMKDIDPKGLDTAFWASVTKEDIYEYLYFLNRECGNKKSSTARRLASLHGFYDYLVNQVNRLDADPTAAIHPPKQDKVLPKYLTAEQSMELLESTQTQSDFPERDYCMVTLFLNCGMRLAELVGAGHTLPFRPELAEEKPLEICFSHVSFSHPGGDKRILDDVSFTLHAGEHTALVGINGAGKSTIVKLICGLYQPTEGNITINGIPLGSLNPAQYYKAIAAVFQDPFALSFSIAENVSCSPLEETDRNRCREALIRAGLWEKIASLPQKEETYLGKDMADDGITLSGGEMQKLMMARALYKNCHLLLLDEPTAALDAISENKMYETYSTLLKNKTALFISHRLASTRFCDTILFLENGKIKECGTHDELIALGGSYAHMFEVQSQYYQETEEDI